MQYLVAQDKSSCGLIKSIKFANYFIKVLYRFWYFNNVYDVLEETKDLFCGSLPEQGAIVHSVTLLSY